MYILIGLLIILALFYAADRRRFVTGVKKALKRDWKVILIFLAAVAGAFYLRVLFNMIDLKASGSSLLDILWGTLLGFIFPGPRYIIYAFIPEFVSAGFGTGFVVALLFSQQLLVQPEGTAFQVRYFGTKYSVYFSLLVIGAIFLFVALFKWLFVLNVAPYSFSQDAGFLPYMLDNIVNLLPVVVLAICLSGVLNEWVDPKFVRKFKSVALISFFGLVTPGPIYEIYPIISVFHKKGMPLHLVTAFLVGQASFGPIRALLEAKILGWNFVLLRLLVSFLMAVFCGYVTRLLSRKLKFLLN